MLQKDELFAKGTGVVHQFKSKLEDFACGEFIIPIEIEELDFISMNERILADQKPEKGMENDIL
jgi:hypothetical protein